jgi:hypothetical protein
MSGIDGPVCSEDRVWVTVTATTWPVAYVEVDANVENRVAGTFVTYSLVTVPKAVDREWVATYPAVGRW